MYHKLCKKKIHKRHITLSSMYQTTTDDPFTNQCEIMDKLHQDENICHKSRHNTLQPYKGKYQYTYVY